MTKPSLHLRRAPASFRLLHPLARAAGSGVLLGLMSTACVVSIHDGGWGDPEECYDEYGDCMDDADNSSEYDACEKTLDACLDANANADEAGDDPTDTSTGDGDGDDAPPHADADSDSDTTAGPDPVCFEIYATCVGVAETVQDVETCAALFDHCANPGECQNPDCGCSEPEPQ
jgi:hypothetical protein